MAHLAINATWQRLRHMPIPSLGREQRGVGQTGCDLQQEGFSLPPTLEPMLPKRFIHLGGHLNLSV